jgi:hypothetical protein
MTALDRQLEAATLKNAQAEQRQERLTAATTQLNRELAQQATKRNQMERRSQIIRAADELLQICIAGYELVPPEAQRCPSAREWRAAYESVIAQTKRLETYIGSGDSSSTAVTENPGTQPSEHLKRVEPREHRDARSAESPVRSPVIRWRSAEDLFSPPPFLFDSK